MTKGKSTLIEKDPQKGTKKKPPQQLQTHNVPINDVVPLRKRIYYSRTVFRRIEMMPQGNKRKFNTHILKESKTRRRKFNYYVD